METPSKNCILFTYFLHIMMQEGRVFLKPQERTEMASIIDKCMSVFKNSEADYSPKSPLRTVLNRTEGDLAQSSLSVDTFTLILIPRSRHIKFTINMNSQMGIKKWVCQPPSANYKQDVWEYLLAVITPTWHYKLHRACKLANRAINPLMSIVQGNANQNHQL